MPETVMVSGWSLSKAIESKVMLATECSKPLPMKANRHQKMAMHLALSLVMRADIQSARQTSQLHRTARAKSAIAGAFIFAAATVRRKPLLECSTPPPPPSTNSAASAAAPTRLPNQENAQAEARSLQPT